MWNKRIRYILLFTYYIALNFIYPLKISLTFALSSIILDHTFDNSLKFVDDTNLLFCRINVLLNYKIIEKWCRDRTMSE